MIVIKVFPTARIGATQWYGALVGGGMGRPLKREVGKSPAEALEKLMKAMAA